MNTALLLLPFKMRVSGDRLNIVTVMKEMDETNTTQNQGKRTGFMPFILIFGGIALFLVLAKIVMNLLGI